MASEFAQFILGTLFNLLIAMLIVRFIYYPRTHEKQYVLTFLAFNTVMFFVMTMLQTTSLGVGVGFGLFAIFSMLRYRTDPIPIREMTYLFIIIALPVINSLIGTTDSFWQLLVANGLVLALLYGLEHEWGFYFESSSRMTYDRIDLIASDRREELLVDLRERTGLPVTRVKIGRMDFLRDSAEIKVYYDAPEQDGQATVAQSQSAVTDPKEA